MPQILSEVPSGSRIASGAEYNEIEYDQHGDAACSNGVPPCALLRNVLTTTLDNERKAELGLPQAGYQVILANPPFSGRVDKDRIVDDVKIGTTTATELLFLKYMMDNLRPGGRCGVIVPEGVLFG